MGSFHDMLKGQLDAARAEAAPAEPAPALVVVSPPEPETVEADVFDPADYSVAEVVEYVEANPDQRAIVLAMEADGKDRKSIAALGD